MDLAEISQDTKDKLKNFIPAYASAKNPLDATTTLFHDDERTVGVLKSFNDDPP